MMLNCSHYRLKPSYDDFVFGVDHFTLIIHKSWVVTAPIGLHVSIQGLF